MTACCFDKAWIGRCKRPTIGARFCAEHTGKLCASCGAQATHECDHTGQFVCGFPLCDDCRGWEDPTKTSGMFGLMNHTHRRKADCRFDRRGLPVVRVKAVQKEA